MKKFQIIIKKNEDVEQIKSLEIRFPNQNNKLWVQTRYFYLFNYVIGFEVTWF